MSIEDYYTETIILLDSDSSTGGYWSTSTGPDYTPAASITAAVNLLSADETNAYDKLGYNAKYKAYCAVSTEVYAGRRCRWNSDTFDIVADPKNTLQKGHHLKILLRDVT